MRSRKWCSVACWVEGWTVRRGLIAAEDGSTGSERRDKRPGLYYTRTVMDRVVFEMHAPCASA